MGLLGVHSQLVAIQAQKDVGRKKGHGLVSVDEGVIHDPGFEQRRGHLGEIGVVAGPGPVQGALQQPGVARARWSEALPSPSNRRRGILFLYMRRC